MTAPIAIHNRKGSNFLVNIIKLLYSGFSPKGVREVQQHSDGGPFFLSCG